MSRESLFASTVLQDFDSVLLGGIQSSFTSTTKTSHSVQNANWIPRQMESKVPIDLDLSKFTANQSWKVDQILKKRPASPLATSTLVADHKYAKLTLTGRYSQYSSSASNFEKIYDAPSEQLAFTPVRSIPPQSNYPLSSPLYSSMGSSIFTSSSSSIATSPPSSPLPSTSSSLSASVSLSSRKTFPIIAPSAIALPSSKTPNDKFVPPRKLTASDPRKPFGSYPPLPPQPFTTVEKGKGIEAATLVDVTKVDYVYTKEAHEGTNASRASWGTTKRLLKYQPSNAANIALVEARHARQERRSLPPSRASSRSSSTIPLPSTSTTTFSTTVIQFVPTFDESVRYIDIAIPIGSGGACKTCVSARRTCYKDTGSIVCRRCKLTCMKRSSNFSELTAVPSEVTLVKFQGPIVSEDVTKDVILAKILSSENPSLSTPSFANFAIKGTKLSASIATLPLTRILEDNNLVMKKDGVISASMIHTVSPSIYASMAIEPMQISPQLRITPVPLLRFFSSVVSSIGTKQIVSPPAKPQSILPAAVLPIAEKLISTNRSGPGRGQVYLEADSNAEFCYCQEVAQGFMVACDGPTCATVWFHLECTALEFEPGEGDFFLCDACK